LYSNDRALVQNVKQEVLSELQQGNYFRASPLINYPNGYNRTGYVPQWHQQNYDPFITDQMYQTVKDSVKNEVLTEIEMDRANRIARMYGIDNSLSDRRLQQMIDARYRTIDDMKADIKRELLALRRIDTQRSGDPYIRQIANALVDESQRRGIPFNQLLDTLDQRNTGGTGLVGRVSDMLNVGQRKGFLCGMGASILFNLIWPFARGNMRSIAVRSLGEGMTMMDKAKSFVGGQYQQNPDPVFSPELPVEEIPPIGDDVTPK
jgi:hypothetical protein